MSIIKSSCAVLILLFGVVINSGLCAVNQTDVPFLTEDAPLYSLAKSFGFSVDSEFSSGRIILTNKNHEIILSVGLDRALVDGCGYPLLSSPRYVGGTMAVPPDLADLVRRFGVSSMDVNSLNGPRRKRKAPIKTAYLPPVVDISANLEAKTDSSPNEYYDGFILIDAGHGGNDSGAIGYKKTKEKDVVLQVAISLAKYLKAKNIKAVLTRSKDVYISPTNRAKIAKQLKPDCLISIHTNSYSQESVNGVETWVVSPKLISNKQTAKTARKLGTVIQSYLVKSTKANNRGLREGVFTILRNSYVPATIVEIGFISNKKEEKNMLSTSWQQKVAESLGDACIASKILKKHKKSKPKTK